MIEPGFLSDMIRSTSREEGRYRSWAVKLISRVTQSRGSTSRLT